MMDDAKGIECFITRQDYAELVHSQFNILYYMTLSGPSMTLKFNPDAMEEAQDIVQACFDDLYNLAELKTSRPAIVVSGISDLLLEYFTPMMQGLASQLYKSIVKGDGNDNSQNNTL